MIQLANRLLTNFKNQIFMKNNDEKYWTTYCTLKRSYQLRTGQMRLPVRAAKPIELQYKAPVAEVITELPREPEIGKIYVYKGHKVQCVAAQGCVGCFRRADLCAENLCNTVNRPDGKSVQFIPVD